MASSLKGTFARLATSVFLEKKAKPPSQQKAPQMNERKQRTLTIYRDDSTVQVVYERVKAVFWTAANTVLVVSRYDAENGDGHHYIHWPRERFCWFKDQPGTAAH